jgi:hypothetical protein
MNKWKIYAIVMSFLTFGALKKHSAYSLQMTRILLIIECL